MKPRTERYTVAVDFDGVLHSYTSPWVAPHVIPDPPVEGAIVWLRRMTGGFDVVIHSTRCKTWRGRRAIRRWLWRWETSPVQEALGYGSFAEWEDSSALAQVQLSYKKVAALVYIDDRAWRFEGIFPTPDEIHAARPWNKPRPASVQQQPMPKGKPCATERS